MLFANCQEDTQCNCGMIYYTRYMETKSIWTAVHSQPGQVVNSKHAVAHIYTSSTDATKIPPIV